MNKIIPKNSTLSTFSLSPRNIRKPLGTLLQSIQKPKGKRKEGCFGGLHCAVSARGTNILSHSIEVRAVAENMMWNLLAAS